MACANNIGLNEITDLGVLLVRDNKRVTENHNSGKDNMEAQGRQSRIPKFGFGFRKLINGSNERSQEQSSSPTVSRSKSMRVPRTQPHPVMKREQHSNSIDNGDQSGPLVKEPSLLHPDSTTRSGSRSNPSSRCNSPHDHKDSSGSFSVDVTDSTSSTDSMRVQVNHVSTGPTTISPPSRGHIRSHSFGSKERHVVAARPGSAASSRRATVSTRKAKSPQPVKRVMTVTQIRKTERTNSIDQPDGIVESTMAGPRRPPENGRKNSVGSQSGRGKRPFSLHEGSPDLNQLATELSQLEESGGVISNDRSHRSIRAQRSPMTQGSSGSVRVSSSKLRPPTKQNSKDDLNRPSSAASNHKLNENRTISRPRSAADVHKVNSTHPQRQTSQTSHGSRSSTPSSGRSTPLFRKTQAGIAEEDEEQYEGRKISYDRVPYRPVGAESRAHSGAVRMGKTPVVRTNMEREQLVRTSQDLGVGLNELEGAVLIDAEDYRRMVQEVKTLKTMLLRLKRELTADGVTTPPSATPPTSMKSSVVRLKQGGGANNTELLNKIQKLTSERDKALQDIDQAKKRQKTQQEQLDCLKSNLEISKKDNLSLTKKLDELETHREYLLDKLERLHADKHKVEDRLNTLEKSAVYERTVLEGVSPEDDEEEGMLMIDEDFDNGLYYDDEDATY